MTYKLNIDWTAFLAEYWQKKPVVIRQGFSDFVDPISADELAGLALEDEVDSRLVSCFDDEWEVENGPFTHFNNLEEENWALLVQSVDHWHEEAAKLVEPFKVLPDWRFDDLMVSFSAPNGSVGPHIDQYGVFIIQGSGKRHWRVGHNTPNQQEVCPHPSLLHVEDFEPIIDTELLPGDILYIPPGFPHDGTSLEASMSFSVGYRAPNLQDLMSHFADYLIENDLGLTFYDDPNIALRQHACEILPSELHRLKSLMHSSLGDDAFFANWFGQFISQSRHELVLMPADPPFTPEEVIEAIEDGVILQRVGGLRVLLIGEFGFANGQALNMRAEQVLTLAKSNQIEATALQPYLDQTDFISALTYYINEGYWYFIE